MIIKVIKSVICLYLKLLAILSIKIHNPYLIVIVGSVGKSTTKDLLSTILDSSGFNYISSNKSYNSDIGVPLSILGLETGYRNPFSWIYICVIAIINSLFLKKEYIVLEIGLDCPGDISSFTSWLKPDISLMTQLAENPVHLENFSCKDELYREKFSILQVTKGTVFLNGSDEIQKKYLHLLDGKKIEYFNTVETIFIDDVRVHYEKGNPIGTDIILSCGKNEMIYIPSVLGGGIVNSLSASIAVALKLGIPFEKIRMAVANHIPTPGRMRILEGKKGSIIIDDSYNASPIATKSALKLLKILDKKKKVIVFGVMGELGNESDKIHKDIGKFACEVSDEVISLEGNYGSCVIKKDLNSCIEHCLNIANMETVFLLKGSQVSRIDKIVKELLSDQIDPKKVLVRQDIYWSNK